MQQQVKLTFQVSKDMNFILEELMKKTESTSKAEVLRKAIAVLKVATEAKDKNQPFGIGKDDDSMSLKIVGI